MMIEYIKKNTGGLYSKSYSKTGNILRKPSKIKKGVMLAIPVDYDKIRIGWSLCNFSKEDEFSDLGMKIAIERAETSSTLRPAHSMVEELRKFIGRAKAYYQDKEVEVTFPLDDEDLVKMIDNENLIEMSFEDRPALEA